MTSGLNYDAQVQANLATQLGQRALENQFQLTQPNPTEQQEVALAMLQLAAQPGLQYFPNQINTQDYQSPYSNTQVEGMQDY